MLAEIPLGVFIGIVLFFVAMAAVIVFAGLTARKRAALVKATPTSPIGMATDGYREFEGTIEAVPGAAVTAPLTGWPCAWYHAKVEKYALGSNTRTGASWHTVHEWTSNAPFFVRDATGVAIVDPFRAEVTPTDKSQWQGKTEQPADRNPAKVKPTESAHGTFEIATTGTFRYSEERIYAGDPLLVLGEFMTHTFDAADEDDDADPGAASPETDPEEARDEALLAAAQKVTRATIGRGSGRQPLIITTTPQAQHIALSEKGGVAAYVVALVPLGIAVLLLWARFG
ncbi:MAG TPA: GIDE domain-containing protein [Vicinamibacterales bacterium]|nr:GIDE domain-containing protein [Vicinamibacterales bacterium]